MPGRISRFLVQTALSRPGSFRVTRSQPQVVYSDRDKPVRVTRAQTSVVFNDRDKPVKITYAAVQVLGSLRQAVEKPKPVDKPLELPALLDREPNPYRPTMPDEIHEVSPVLADFIGEHTAIQREQHNTTQAGDSTFGWELLTKIGPERLYTLGSLGRFYHDEYGIILARYCQFTGMAEATPPGSPVGRVRSDDVVSWRVTSDYARSGGDLVVGVMGSFRPPEEGWYGWVLTQGATHVPMLMPYGDETGQNQQLVWSDTGVVSTKGVGQVLGRVVGASVRVNDEAYGLPDGSVILGVEGPSIESLQAKMGETFEPYKKQIESIQNDLNKADFANLLPKLQKLVETVADHTHRLEEIDQQGLKGKLDALQRKLDGLNLEQLGQKLYDQIMEVLGLRLKKIEQSVVDLTDRFNALPDYGLRLESLEGIVGRLSQGIRKRLIPLVDGSIPPNLVYLPNGELVFVEIEL